MRSRITSLFMVIALFAGIALQAQTIYGITAGPRLIKFNASNSATILEDTTITGIALAQTLVGIDFRPRTAELYALGYNQALSEGQLYIIDTVSGVATPVGNTLALVLGLNEYVSFDFNPTVDRIRVVGENGANYRLNPDNGTVAATDTDLAYDTSDANEGNIPSVVAVAYTNSYDSATTTTLYAYDYVADVLGKLTSPNSGIITTIGDNDRDFDRTIDMDISKYNEAYLVGGETASDDSIYRVNLTTGDITPMGGIGSGMQVSDIAVYTDGIRPTTGIGNIAAAIDMLVYPNPATDKVTVRMTTSAKDLTLTLTDIAGRQMLRYPVSQVNGNVISVDMSGYAQGMYYLSIDNGTSRVVKAIGKY